MLHNNDVTDPRYKGFLGPIIIRFKNEFSKNSKGLDLGCGTGTVATVEWMKLGYSVNFFDPFFQNHPQALKKPYDFLICSEVMEHFHHPYQGFNILYVMLNPKGNCTIKQCFIMIIWTLETGIMIRHMFSNIPKKVCSGSKIIQIPKARNIFQTYRI